MEYGSREVCIAAVKLALTQDRDSENTLKKNLRMQVLKQLRWISEGSFRPRWEKLLRELLLRQEEKIL